MPRSSRFRHLTLLLTLVALIGSSVPVYASVDPKLERLIEDAIRQRDPKDTPAWWRSLGPAAPAAIIDLYEKTDTIYERLRLVGALGWFNDPQAIEFLKTLALSTPQDVIRNDSILSVGNAAGANEMGFISSFLKSADPQTRIAAGQALRKMGNPRANSILERFYKRERMPWVTDRVKNAPLGPHVTAGAPLLHLQSQSEKGLNPALAGNWKGVLIVPSPENASLLRIDVQAKTAIQGSSVLTGTLTLKFPKAPAKLLELKQVKGKADQISGLLSGNALLPWGGRPLVMTSPSPAVGASGNSSVSSKPSSVFFKGEFLKRGNSRILRLESDEVLMTVLLRKQ